LAEAVAFAQAPSARCRLTFVVSDLHEQFPGQMADVGQTFRHMNTPCKELERIVAERRLNHGGNPVLRWMLSHAVAERNQDDLIRISRKKSSDKVDGVVALQGGLPILVDGRVIGAVGVSGVTSQQDEEVAAAGIAAIKQ
jgi:hypothetical protein